MHSRDVAAAKAAGMTTQVNVTAERFCNLLRSMTPGALHDMTQAIMDGQFKTFCQSRAQKGEEAFLSFYLNHEFDFISRGNTINWKMTSTTEKVACVFRIENRFGQPLQVDHELRSGPLSNLLTRNYAEYEVGTLKRTVRVTEFCENANLVAFSRAQRSDEALIDSALHLYSEMADYLTRLVKAGYAFPDMKNANWLVHLNHLRVADTKSFTRVHPETGQIMIPSSTNDAPGGLITTATMRPPELPPFIADKFHANLLGRNLYEYLTHRMWDESSDFNHPIFKSPQGQRLEALIRQSVMPDPARRPGVEAMGAELGKIRQIPYVECEALLTVYKENISQSPEQVRPLEIKLAEAKNLVQISALKRELEVAILPYTKNQYKEKLKGLLVEPVTIMTPYYQKKWTEVDGVQDPQRLKVLLKELEEDLARAAKLPKCLNTLSEYSARSVGLRHMVDNLNVQLKQMQPIEQLSDYYRCLLQGVSAMAQVIGPLNKCAEVLKNISEHCSMNKEQKQTWEALLQRAEASITPREIVAVEREVKELHSILQTITMSKTVVQRREAHQTTSAEDEATATPIKPLSF